MKKLLLVLLCFPLLFSTCKKDENEPSDTGNNNGVGQGWEKTYQSDIWSCIGYSVKQTTDGGYIIVTSGSVIKTDDLGDTLWTRSGGGFDIELTSDGGFIIAGETNGYTTGNIDMLLIKVDANGYQEWINTYAVLGKAVSVQQTNDGGYIALGEGLVLIKTDANGNETWNHAYNYNYSYIVGKDVQQTLDGGYIITGYGGDDTYPFLIKTDGSGNQLWRRDFDNGETSEAQSVQQTSDGGYIFTGGTHSFPITNQKHAYLIKTDANGNTDWSKILFINGRQKAYSVQQTFDGGYILAGYSEDFDGDDEDVFLVKTNINGEQEWSRTFGGNDDDRAYSVQRTNDGGYIITGYKDDDISGLVYLIKTDVNGDATSTLNIPMNTSKRKSLKATDILGREVKQTN